MTNPRKFDFKVSDEEFIEIRNRLGEIGAAAHFGCGSATVHRKVKQLAHIKGRDIIVDRRFQANRIAPVLSTDHVPNWLPVDIQDGCAVIFSDAHFWPERRTTAFYGLCKVLKDLGSEVKLIVANGDILDGARISRFPPSNWDHRPTLKEELEECQHQMAAIQDCAPKAKRIWPVGNHDMRFEIRLASEIPEFAGIVGTKLKDHFPFWEPTMSMIINDSVVAKHRWKGGIHAAFNNTRESGRTIITGHTHKLISIPYTDYNGTRFGIESGTLADSFGPQFDYAEENPRNWISGFVVLRFYKGKLMLPNLARVFEPGKLEFANKVYDLGE
jgi:hypothetical protein